MEEGSKKRNPITDSTQRDGNRWGSNAREQERRGKLQPWLTPKMPKGNNRTNHHPQKKEKLTSNIQHALRNQCRKLISLLIVIIPSSSFNDIMALPPPSSFLVRQEGLAYRLLVVDPLELGALQKEEKHGRAREAGLALTIKLILCVSNSFGSECECAWWE